MEMDELYWFLEYKPRTETRENIYIMTMVSREPRQIIGHVVSRDKTSRTIQKMVDAAPMRNVIAQMGTLDIWMSSFRGSISSIFTTNVYTSMPSQKIIAEELSRPAFGASCSFAFNITTCALRACKNFLLHSAGESCIIHLLDRISSAGIRVEVPVSRNGSL